MRLTAQIGEYKMDQAILGLGSDMNVFPKQTWEKNGETCATVAFDSIEDGESTENHPNGEVAGGNN